MTENDWLTCSEPKPMLRFLLGTDAPRVQDVEKFPSCKASDRKLRLFAYACFRHIRHLLASRPLVEDALEVAERYADGIASTDELQQTDARLMDSLDAFEGAWRASRGAERTALVPIHEALALALQITRPEAPKAAYYASSNAYLAYAAILNPGDAARVSGSYTSQRAEEKDQAALLRDIIGNPFQPSPALDPYVLAWNDGCIPKLAAAIYEERDFSCERMGVLADTLEEAGADAVLLNHLRQQGGVHVRGCWVVDLLTGRA